MPEFYQVAGAEAPGKLLLCPASGLFAGCNTAQSAEIALWAVNMRGFLVMEWPEAFFSPVFRVESMFFTCLLYLSIDGLPPRALFLLSGRYALFTYLISKKLSF